MSQDKPHIVYFRHWYPRFSAYFPIIFQLAYQFCKEITEQQLTDLMQKEIEIIRIMSKPSFEEMERRKPLVADGIQPRKFERDETFNLLKQYRRCLARTSVPGVKQVSSSAFLSMA